uniref:MADF domain-containing protein n=1 Tax=Anopheles christyi TaxID=43041 RepID=A0A182K5U9_9DIPT
MSEFLVKLKEEVVLTLINTLRRTPVLWKQDEPGYRDLGVQQEAWNSVAEQFGVPVDNLKEKWKMLRTQFRANLSKIRSRSMNGADGEPSYQPTWFAFEAMKFLRETPECAMPKTVNIPAKHVTATSSVEDSSGGYPYETDAQEVILELIKEIKQKPVLWDITHPLHKNAAVQFRAWKTLSDRLNLPITDMKRKWQHLRVQFRNNLRKVESMSTPEEVYEPSWFAFEAMQFIRRNYSTDPEKPVVT